MTNHTAAKYFQHTLKGSFSCIGQGLHSGQKVFMSVMPAEAHSGYTFVRRDLPSDRAIVPARFNAVTDTRLSTTISNAMGAKVSTIEHLLAALRACDIDNARITLDGPEVPIMDGSAAPFINMIEQTGVKQQSQLRMAILLTKSISVEHGESTARLSPAAQPSIELSIDFDNPSIGQQRKFTLIEKNSFAEHYAGARTFGFKDQLDTLRKLGLAKGGNLNNAVLLDESGVINPEGLRYDDEFVRHKVLDVIGDIALAGCPIIGKFTGHRTGHALNNQLLRELMRNEQCWHYTTMAEAELYWQELTETEYVGRSNQFVNDAVSMR
ncbi:MAG: UDP-3-O-acyl-N-acetylglucosamine deacetylase [Halopseudomonas sp.]